MGSAGVCECVCMFVCVCVTIIKKEATFLEGGMGRIAGKEEDRDVFRYEILKK